VSVAGNAQLKICRLAATADKAIDEPLVAFADQRNPMNACGDAFTTNWASRAISNVDSQIKATIAAPGVRVQRPHN
jgi:hypothetical protein